MLVSIATTPKTVVVTQLRSEAGGLVSTGNMLELGPGEQFGYVPYERLRALGDGAHDLAEEGDWVVRPRRDSGPLSWLGWLCLALFFAGVSSACYWLFADFEADGGRMRIHWIVALVYGIGGKWGAAALFAVPAVVMLGLSIKTFSSRSTPAIRA